jgi:hypothetical protein
MRNLIVSLWQLKVLLFLVWGSKLNYYSTNIAIGGYKVNSQLYFVDLLEKNLGKVQ